MATVHKVQPETQDQIGQLTVELSPGEFRLIVEALEENVKQVLAALPSIGTQWPPATNRYEEFMLAGSLVKRQAELLFNLTENFASKTTREDIITFLVQG